MVGGVDCRRIYTLHGGCLLGMGRGLMLVEDRFKRRQVQGTFQGHEGKWVDIKGLSLHVL